GALLDFHSFPTRRSSDLASRAWRNVGSAGTRPCSCTRGGRPDSRCRTTGSHASAPKRAPSNAGTRNASREPYGTCVGKYETKLRSEEHTSELQSRENPVC